MQIITFCSVYQDSGMWPLSACRANIEIKTAPGYRILFFFLIALSGLGIRVRFISCLETEISEKLELIGVDPHKNYLGCCHYQLFLFFFKKNQLSRRFVGGDCKNVDTKVRISSVAYCSHGNDEYQSKQVQKWFFFQSLRVYNDFLLTVKKIRKIIDNKLLQPRPTWRDLCIGCVKWISTDTTANWNPWQQKTICIHIAILPSAFFQSFIIFHPRGRHGQKISTLNDSHSQYLEDLFFIQLSCSPLLLRIGAPLTVVHNIFMPRGRELQAPEAWHAGVAQQILSSWRCPAREKPWERERGPEIAVDCGFCQWQEA